MSLTVPELSFYYLFRGVTSEMQTSVFTVPPPRNRRTVVGITEVTKSQRNRRQQRRLQIFQKNLVIKA